MYVQMQNINVNVIPYIVTDVSVVAATRFVLVKLNVISRFLSLTTWVSQHVKESVEP